MFFSTFGLVVLVLSCLLVGMFLARRRKNAGGDIQVMNITGMIAYSDAPESLYQKTMRTLDAVELRKPKTLIVHINSPGGTVGATHEIYVRLNQLRGMGIKVVTLMADVAASGGLYVAMASDYVIASPGTITGSIGCIMQGFEYNKVLDMVNVGVRTIKSGAHKDMTSPFRELDEEGQHLLQELVNETRNNFCAAIFFCRKDKGLTWDALNAIADGRVFSGKKAVEYLLVDSLGSLPYAVEVAAAIGNVHPMRRKPVMLRPRVPFIVKMGPSIPGMRLENRLLSLLPEASLLNVPLLMMKGGNDA